MVASSSAPRYLFLGSWLFFKAFGPTSCFVAKKRKSNFTRSWRKDGLLDQTLCFFFSRGQNCFFLTKTRDLLDGNVQNADRPLRMLPLVFREFSWALFRYSRVAVGLLFVLIMPVLRTSCSIVFGRPYFLQDRTHKCFFVFGSRNSRQKEVCDGVS